MAVRFDNAADSLARTTDLLNYNGAYTFMFWVYLTSDTNDFNTFFQISQGGYAPSDWIGTDTDGTTLQLYCQAASGGTTVNGSALSINTWYHITLVRESQTSFKCYLNGVLDITNTADMTSRAAATEMRFGSIGGADAADMRVFDSKSWSAALSIPEIFAEMQNIDLQRFTNLYGWWPHFAGSGERADDYSGNGRDWTEAGTLTDEDNAPVAWSVFLPQVRAISSSLSIEQEGFRFRDDDGSEAAATWRQAQDTNDTIATATRFRLRFLLNTSGDQPAKNFRIQVKKSTDPDAAYRSISVKQ